MKKIISVLLAAAFASLLSCRRDPDSFLNFGFEKIDRRSGFPANWMKNIMVARNVSLDSTVSHSGKYSIRMDQFSDSFLTSGAYRMITDIKPQKSLTLSGYIKTLNASLDSAGFLLVAQKEEKDTVIRIRDKRLVGTNDWQEFSIDFPVDGMYDYFYVGISFAGTGKMWFDDLKLVVDGKELKRIPKANGYTAGKDELEWLERNAVVLKSVDAGSGFDDLQPLRELIGNARIVALGENTHGTAEVFKLKHRLVEFLVKEMGFNIFTIESNMPEAAKVNDYIHENSLYLSGKDALKNLYFWTWNTQEVLNMVDWMKAFNAENNGRLQFTGNDMQYYKGAFENLSRFAASNDPVLKAGLDSLSGNIEIINQYGSRAMQQKDKITVIRKKCERLYDHMLKSEKKFGGKIPDGYKWQLQNCAVLIQNAKMAELGMEGSSYRDEMMAQNTGWILENNPGAKIVLWAHNGHVSKDKDCMGSWLGKKYGKDYYNIGFVSNSGTYTAVSIAGLTSGNLLKEGMPGSFEYSFHKTGLPLMLFDFSRVSDSIPESRWLKGRLMNRNIGAVAVEGQFRPATISREYNAIIYIDKTNATRCFSIRQP